MEQKDMVREINLWDMLWYVCLKWRSILACAIVCAVLAGGFSYYKSSKEIVKAKNSSPIKAEDMAKGLTYEERKTAEVYMSYKQMYEEMVYYNENAPLMQLNANDFYKGEVSYYIDNYFQIQYPVIGSSNNIVAMVNSYRAFLQTEEVAEQMKAIVGDVENSSYVLEVLDCQGVYAGKNKIENNEEAGVFSVTVYGRDKESCEALKEIVKEVVNTAEKDVVKQFGEHDIIILQDAVSNISSSDLLEKQKTTVDMAYTCSNNMYNISTKFSDCQQAYVDTKIKELETVDLQIEQENDNAQISIKLIIVGFLLGAFLAFAVWAIIYSFSSKLRVEDDFENIYKRKLLGNVKIENQEKKKWFGFIDAIFVKLRHYNQRYFSKEESLEMIAANIRIALKKADNDKVFITGAICGKEEKQIAEELAKCLEKDNIEVIFGKSIIYNAESLEKMADTGSVVLFEQAMASLYHEVQKEIQICSQLNVDLIGCVLLY